MTVKNTGIPADKNVEKMGRVNKQSIILQHQPCPDKVTFAVRS